MFIIFFDPQSFPQASLVLLEDRYNIHQHCFFKLSLCLIQRCLFLAYLRCLCYKAKERKQGKFQEHTDLCTKRGKLESRKTLVAKLVLAGRSP